MKEILLLFVFYISCINCWGQKFYSDSCDNADALCLDGEGDYVIIPGSKSLNVQNFTFEGWIKTKSFKEWQCIFEFNSTTEIGAHFYLRRKGRILFANLIDISGTPHMYQTVDSLLWDTGQCYHVALVRCNKEVSFYIDGNYYPSKLVSEKPLGDLPIATNLNLYFGGRIGVEGLKYEFNGSFEGFRLWDTAWYQDDIQQHINGEISDSDPNLVGYWTFSHIKDTVWDSSLKHNYGFLVGDAGNCPKKSKISNIDFKEPVSITVIYPNPAHNNLFISGYKTINENTITVYDILSRKLMNIKVSSISKNRVRIDISHLKAGIYVLKFNNDFGVYSYKFNTY